MASIWKIGVDSTHMVSLPSVINCTSPLQLVGGTRTSAGGSQTLQVVAKKKSITLTFDYCTDAEYDTIAQFNDGRKGSGPFLYQDPREASARTVNILQLDDASSLEGYRDSGFTLVLVEV